MIFISKTSHLASLWNGGWDELGNGLFCYVYYTIFLTLLLVWGHVSRFGQWYPFHHLLLSFPDKTGRKKRNHVREKYRMCSKQDERKLNECLNKTGGFNFKQKCTYTTAYCQYTVSCSHVGSLYNAKYKCNTIVHLLNVRDVCCKPICWFSTLWN